MVAEPGPSRETRPKLSVSFVLVVLIIAGVGASGWIDMVNAWDANQFGCSFNALAVFLALGLLIRIPKFRGIAIGCALAWLGLVILGGMWLTSLNRPIEVNFFGWRYDDAPDWLIMTALGIHVAVAGFVAFTLARPKVRRWYQRPHDEWLTRDQASKSQVKAADPTKAES